jgi:hypothetical protein
MVGACLEPVISAPCRASTRATSESNHHDSHTSSVETEEQFSSGRGVTGPRLGRTDRLAGATAIGERATWIAGLVLSISAFTDWYAGSGSVGPTIGVIGWHTGALGKLVFFIGLAVVALVALREAGIELPPTVPDSLVVIALGSLSTIFVLIRLISIPDEFLPASGRGIGIWISLLASLAVIGAGLLRASEEL